MNRIHGVITVDESYYRIKYRKKDFEIEVQGDKEWVEKKFEALTNAGYHENTSTATKSTNEASPDANPTQVTNPELSVVEFLRSKGNPKTHTDRVLVFCYWLHYFKKIDSYNVKDIETCYSEARIIQPKNLSDSLNKVQKKGYIMPVSDEKEKMKTWVITQSGEEYINSLE